MSAEKTEDPTPKKLKEAREKGEIAYSKDFTQTCLILALWGYMTLNASNIVEALGRLILIPEHLTGLPFDTALKTMLELVMRDAALLFAPFLIISLGVGLFSDFLQVGVVLAFKKLIPDGQRINPATNLKNTFSMRNLIEFIKSNIKIIFLTVLIAKVILDALPALVAVPHNGLPGLASALGDMMAVMMANVALVYIVISLADLVWQRKQNLKDHRMTKDEVKREYKEMEGDPTIKGHRKQLHQELATQTASANTRKSSVVITNPTHLAIAIFYEQALTPLPIVLAKGAGGVAEAMVRVAREEAIPVMQNIPLARALMADAKIEQYIPTELIEPVAQVLRLIMQLAQEPEELI